MGRLEDKKKNILMIIPTDYYNEKQLEVTREIFIKEGAEVRVASAKFKEAVGDKSGRFMPDVLTVDSIEGITGDSYVSDGKGVRQIKGVFHAVVLIGGKGARKHLWKEKLVRLIIIDRHKNNMVVAAIGSAVPCLADAELISNMEVACESNKYTLQELERVGAVISDLPVVVAERIVTGSGADAAEEFANTVIDLVLQTDTKDKSI